jgi:hypothetical protein
MEKSSSKVLMIGIALKMWLENAISGEYWPENDPYNEFRRCLLFCVLRYFC